MQLRINIPPLTRILLAILIVVSVVYQLTRFESWTAEGDPDFLAVIPQWSLFYPWTFFTATYAEQNVFTLLVTGATILYGGKYLERAWTTKEFGKFVLVVTLIPNFAASVLYVLLFAIVRQDEQAFTIIQGSVALQAGFLVAFKQLVPEHTVTILRGLVKIRVKHFPAIFLAANTISGIILGTDTALVLAWLGFGISWTYLRFFKYQPDISGAVIGGGQLRGDASETFAFAYFWPDAIQPPIAAVGDRIYNALVAARMLSPFSAEDIETSNEQASVRVEGGLPSLLNTGGGRRLGGKREEAERRRALALKALDQRLHAATANRQQATSSATPAVEGSHETAPRSEEGAAEGREIQDQ